MNIDYLFVGISRGNRNDYKELFRLTKAKVYAVAISHVKDKNLAKEILVETYKRVWMYAYSYNTDMDGEQWILEIARNLSMNALLDKNLVKSYEKRLQDNISKICIDIISNLSGDRGKVVLLKILTDMSDKDLAGFLWFSPGALKKEYRNGLKELEDLDSQYKEFDIPATVLDNFPECVPDVWNLIDSDYQTAISYTSHEVLDLEPEDYAFGEKEDGNLTEDTAEAKQIDENLANKIKKKQKTSKIVMILAIIAVVIIATVITIVIVNDRQENKTKPNYNEYYGSPQYNTKIGITEAGGKIYFQNTAEDNTVYIADVNGNSIGKAVKAEGIKAKDFVSDGKFFYYRSLADGYIYRAAPDGTNSVKFSDMAASNLSIFGNKLYFSGSDGIYSMSLEGGESTLVYDCSTDENLERYDIEISEEGTVFFSAGAWKGIHYLTEYKSETSIDTVFIDEAYTLQTTENRLYFTYLGASELYIYYFELDDLDSKTHKMVENIEPGTGAFYSKGGYLYYEGFTSGEKGMENHGIYRISEAGGNPELLFSYDPSGKMYVADLFVTDSLIFCFYSSGEKNGKTSLEVRSINNPSVVISNLF